MRIKYKNNWVKWKNWVKVDDYHNDLYRMHQCKYVQFFIAVKVSNVCYKLVKCCQNLTHMWQGPDSRDVVSILKFVVYKAYFFLIGGIFLGQIRDRVLTCHVTSNWQRLHTGYSLLLSKSNNLLTKSLKLLVNFILLKLWMLFRFTLVDNFWYTFAIS